MKSLGNAGPLRRGLPRAASRCRSTASGPIASPKVTIDESIAPRPRTPRSRPTGRQRELGGTAGQILGDVLGGGDGKQATRRTSSSSFLDRVRRRRLDARQTRALRSRPIESRGRSHESRIAMRIRVGLAAALLVFAAAPSASPRSQIDITKIFKSESASQALQRRHRRRPEGGARGRHDQHRRPHRAESTATSATPRSRSSCPSQFQTVEQGLRMLGQGQKVDELVLAMNRAAEKAAPAAKDIFWTAIKGMTLRRRPQDPLRRRHRGDRLLPREDERGPDRRLPPRRRRRR